MGMKFEGIGGVGEWGEILRDLLRKVSELSRERLEGSGLLKQGTFKFFFVCLCVTLWLKTKALLALKIWIKKLSKSQYMILSTSIFYHTTNRFCMQS
jgi:hypothetical protein